MPSTEPRNSRKIVIQSVAGVPGKRSLLAGVQVKNLRFHLAARRARTASPALPASLLLQALWVRKQGLRVRPRNVILSAAKDLRLRRAARLRRATLPVIALFLQAPYPALAQAPPASPRYTVFLDAAHGGPDTGARLTDQLNEKDLTLALSVRLRSTLTAHGIPVATTRESDTNPPPDTRAAAANRAHPAACLLLHATTSGTGVHLYTSALAPNTPAPAPTPGALQPWATAQASYLTQSLKLASDLSAALTHASIPIILGSISLAPVDNMACPSVILELAPLLPRRTAKAAPLTDPAYQTRLIDALTGALEQWRVDWRAQP